MRVRPRNSPRNSSGPTSVWSTRKCSYRGTPGQPLISAKQLRELARDAPAALAPKPQPGVRRRLVLQQHVQPCRRAAGLAPDRVQQVGFAFAQAVVNEADRIELDTRPQQAAMKRVGLRTGWLALVALFFLPPQRSLPRGAGANLLMWPRSHPS